MKKKRRLKRKEGENKSPRGGEEAMGEGEGRTKPRPPGMETRAKQMEMSRGRRKRQFYSSRFPQRS